MDEPVDIIFRINEEELQRESQAVVDAILNVGQAGEKVTIQLSQEEAAQEALLKSFSKGVITSNEYADAQGRLSKIFDDLRNNTSTLGQVTSETANKEEALLNTVSAIPGPVGDMASKVKVVTDVKKGWSSVVSVLNSRLGWTKVLCNALLISGVGALAIGVGLAIVAFQRWQEAQEKAQRASRQLAEINQEASKQIAKVTTDFDRYNRIVTASNATDAEKKKVLKELNEKYGDTFGKVKNISDLEEQLISRAPAYIAMMTAKAQAQAAMNLSVQANEETLKKVAKSDKDLLRERLGVSDNPIVQAAKDYQIFHGKSDVEIKKEADTRRKAIETQAKYESKVYVDAMLEAEQKATEIAQKNGFKESKDKKTPSTKALENAAKTARDKLSLEAVSAENKTNSLVIAAMEEGTVKRIAQINNDYDKQIDAIDKKLKEVEKLEAAAKKDGKFTKDDKANVDKIKADLADAKQAASTEKDQKTREVEKESAKVINEIWDDVNSHFRTELDNNLAAIDRYYDEQIDKAIKASKAVTEEEKQAIRGRFNARRTEEKRQATTEDKLRYNDFNAGIAVTRHDIMSSGSGMTELAERQRTEITLKYANARMKILEKETDERSRLEKQQLQNTIDGYNKSLSKPKSIKNIVDEKAFNQVHAHFVKLGKTEEEATQATYQFFDKFKKGGEIASDVLGTMKGLFGGISEELDMALDAAMNIANGFAQGGLVGGIEAAAGSLIGTVGKLLTSKKEVDASMIEGYKAYMEVIDKLIDKQISSLEALGGQDFVNAISKSFSDIEKKMKATGNILSETLKSGAGVFSHSIAYSINKELNALNGSIFDILKGKSATKKWEDALNEVGIKHRDIAQFTDEELMALQQIPELYAKLPAEVQEYINSLVEAKEAQEALNKQLQDMILGFDYSDITTAIVDSFTDPSVDNAMETFGGKVDNMIAGIVKNLITKFALVTPVTKAIEELMKGIATYDDKGNITGFKDVKDIEAGVLSNFKSTILELGAGFGKMWDEMGTYLSGYGVDILGKLENENSKQQTISGAFKTMSQDSADILTGQFTAIRIHASDISTILRAMQSDRKIVDKRVEDIAKNTKESADSLKSIDEKLKKMQVEGVKIQ